MFKWFRPISFPNTHTNKSNKYISCKEKYLKKLRRRRISLPPQHGSINIDSIDTLFYEIVSGKMYAKVLLFSNYKRENAYFLIFYLYLC